MLYLIFTFSKKIAYLGNGDFFVKEKLLIGFTPQLAYFE